MAEKAFFMEEFRNETLVVDGIHYRKTDIPKVMVNLNGKMAFGSPIAKTMLFNVSGTHNVMGLDCWFAQFEFTADLSKIDSVSLILDEIPEDFLDMLQGYTAINGEVFRPRIGDIDFQPYQVEDTKYISVTPGVRNLVEFSFVEPRWG